MALSTSSGLSVAVAGEIWWGGFTAEITITNTTGSALSGWSYSFDSPHQLNSAPWGATLQAEPLDNGLIRYTLSGADWGGLRFQPVARSPLDSMANKVLI